MKLYFLKNLCLIVLLSSFCLSISSQTKTISEKGKNEREPASKHKLLLIPFEPKLYLSEADYAFHQKTQLSPRQLKNKFRDGLNEQLYKALRANGFSVIDLMDDTVKYKKDTEGIYQYLTYDYQKVPDQTNYQPPKKEKSKQAVEKGQLNVETNSDVRFMNAKLTNAKVVPMMYAKYKTDLFLFINQLDIKEAGAKENNQYTGLGSENRKIIVHYTIYTYDAKEINSGIAEEEFPIELNEPKKIIDKHFSKIALTITQRLIKYLPVSK